MPMRRTDFIETVNKEMAGVSKPRQRNHSSPANHIEQSRRPHWLPGVRMTLRLKPDDLGMSQ